MGVFFWPNIYVHTVVLQLFIIQLPHLPLNNKKHMIIPHACLVQLLSLINAFSAS